MPAQSATQVQPGDVVKLRSGGPPMTVVAPSPRAGDRVLCFWFAGSEVREGEFSFACLELTKSGGVGAYINGSPV